MSETAELAPSELVELRELLVAKIEEIEQSLTASQQDAKPVDLGLSIGRLSRVDALQQQHMAIARRERIGAQRRELCAALSRLEAGRYGKCIECEEPIGCARLRARPETQFCRSCQPGGRPR